MLACRCRLTIKFTALSYEFSVTEPVLAHSIGIQMSL